MDVLGILVVFLLLAIPVSIIVLFVQTSGLKSRVAMLQAQLAATHAELSRLTTDDDATVRVVKKQAAPEIAAKPLPEAQTPWDRATARSGANQPSTSLPPTAIERPAPRILPLTAIAVWLRENWVYAVSATSLALAGVFFVQYGVERGLLPPGARVLAALGFGAVLIGSGEWLRRRHGDEGATSTVYLPSVFSGAGIVTLFAAVLAARQLYGLIGPEVAFGGHLLTAALAIILGWYSGPLLVSVGLLGAAAAPFLVSGRTDAVDWLYGYFALVAAVGLAVDAIRKWGWVSILALALSFGGGLLLQLGDGSDLGWIALLVVLVGLAAILPEMRLVPAQAGPATLLALLGDDKSRPSFPVALVVGTVLASTVGLFLTTGRNADIAMLAMAALTLLALALLLWAEKAEGLDDVALLPTVGFLGALCAMGVSPGPLWRDFAAHAIALRPPETAPPLTVTLLLAMATLISLSAAYRALRSGRWGVPFGLAAVLVAPLTAAALELLWHPAEILGPYPWALHIIVLAGLMTALALKFGRLDAPDMRRAAHAGLSALALIALAMFLLTTKTALTLALAVLVMVAAALDRRFRLPEMSLFLQAGAAVLGYRLLIDPGLDWALGAALPQVLLAFGGTIAAMLAALWLLAPLPRPTAKAVAESAAAGLAAILANVLITRWLDSPAGYHLETHWGLTLNAMPWLMLMLMQLYRARVGGPLTKLRYGLAALGGVISAGGVGLAASIGNPLFSYAPGTGALVRGPLVLDSLALAYAMPGLILLAAAWKLPGLGARLQLAFIGIGAALLALYTGLEIRRFWQGDWLGIPGITQPELYTYTLALMVLGAGLLYQAIAKRSDGLRRIAMAVIALVVAKVFLIDASGLTGLTRVVSFAGLGLSLAGLAWLNRWAGQAADKP